VTEVKVEPPTDGNTDQDVKSLVAAVNKLTNTVTLLQEQNARLMEKLAVSRQVRQFTSIIYYRLSHCK
jgi:hypothetical protein